MQWTELLTKEGKRDKEINSPTSDQNNLNRSFVLYFNVSENHLIDSVSLLYSI